MKNKAIICDLDGTLSNSVNRQHYVECEHKNFEKFYEEAINDEPNEWCKTILNSLPEDITIIILTGRPNKWLTDFMNWAEKNEIYYDAIYTRKDGDFRQDYIIKQEIYDKEIKPYCDVLFCLDDRQQVVDMWRKNGLVCLQCCEGNF